MLNSLTVAPAGSRHTCPCASTHRHVYRLQASRLCPTSSQQQPSRFHLGATSTFGVVAPQSVAAPTQATTRNSSNHASEPPEAGGPNQPSSQGHAPRSPANAGVFDAAYEEQLRQLRQLLTPDALAEMKASLPPAELQNLRKVLADMRQLGDAEDVPMLDDAPPSPFMTAPDAPHAAMRPTRVPMQRGASAQASTTAPASQGRGSPVFRQPTRGMPVGARLAARQDPARQMAARLGLPYDFYSFLKQQVFPGSLDHDMATFVDTMGLELLQQSASLYQEMVDLQSQPFDAIKYKYLELSHKMEQLMKEALQGSSASPSNDSTSASLGTNTAPSQSGSSTKQQASRKPRTARPAPSPPDSSAQRDTPQDTANTAPARRPWGASFSSSRHGTAPPAAPPSLAQPASGAEQHMPQATPMQFQHPFEEQLQQSHEQQQPSQQYQDDELIIARTVDSPAQRRTQQQVAAERRFLSGKGSGQSGAVPRSGAGRSRGPLFQRAVNPPFEAM